MEKDSKVVCKNISNPDERMDFKQRGGIDVFKFEDGTIGARAIFKPGWKWSVDEKPYVNTDTCQTPHTGYCVSGSVVIKLENGEESTIKAGDFFEIPAGHDAWVPGDQTCELVLIEQSQKYSNESAA